MSGKCHLEEEITNKLRHADVELRRWKAVTEFCRQPVVTAATAAGRKAPEISYPLDCTRGKIRHGGNNCGGDAW